MCNIPLEKQGFLHITQHILLQWYLWMGIIFQKPTTVPVPPHPPHMLPETFPFPLHTEQVLIRGCFFSSLGLLLQAVKLKHIITTIKAIPINLIVFICCL